MDVTAELTSSLPALKKEKIRKMARAYNKPCQELDSREPTDEETAGRLGWTAKEVRDARSVKLGAASSNGPGLQREPASEVGDVTVDGTALEPSATAIAKVERARLEARVSRLPKEFVGSWPGAAGLAQTEQPPLQSLPGSFTSPPGGCVELGARPDAPSSTSRITGRLDVLSRRRARPADTFGTQTRSASCRLRWANVPLGLYTLSAPQGYVSAGHNPNLLLDVWVMSAVVAAVMVLAVIALVRIASKPKGALGRQARRLCPQKIVQYKADEEPPGPELLSRQIVERARQIRATLSQRPSGVEVEMCLMGYAACADDVLELAQMIEKEKLRSGFLRRLRLKLAWRRATDSLSHARTALPPSAIRASHRGPT